MIKVHIVPNDKGNPPGKLADVELHFVDVPVGHAAACSCATCALRGLKLIGFAIWQRRAGSGLNVTFPARQYSVNGERRAFALLRPTSEANATNTIRDLIIDAWRQYERSQQPTQTADEQAAAASTETTRPQTDLGF